MYEFQVEVSWESLRPANCISGSTSICDLDLVKEQDKGMKGTVHASKHGEEIERYRWRRRGIQTIGRRRD